MGEKHKWWENAVAYQIYPRSFQDSNGDGIGDLAGLISRIPYLHELGVDLIWICPIYPSPNDDNGYDISDYEEVDPVFGTMTDMKKLLEEAHARGIRVILDLVINHTSDRHPWFVESRSSRTSAKRDWYIWRDGKGELPPNNWESIFGGSAWEWDEKTAQYYLHVFGRTMPDLNWENPDTREALFAMVRSWLDFGIDGFRVDAISHIYKPDLSDLPNPERKPFVSSFVRHMNYPGITDLLQHLKKEAFADRDIFTVAEANGVKTTEIGDWVGREQGVFQALFQFDHLNLWNVELPEGGVSLVKVKRALSKWQNATDQDGCVGLVMENHDLVRSISRFGDSKTYWKESGKCLALLYFMQKGVPFIYQGQEIGMLNADYTSVSDFRDVPFLKRYEEKMQEGMDPKEAFALLSEITRDNTRTPMQWDTAENAGFTTGIPWIPVNGNYTWLNVAAQKEDPDSIWHFYRRLITLRKENACLRYGKYTLFMPEDPQVYVYTREDGQETWCILGNVSPKKAALALPFSLGKGECVLRNLAGPMDSQWLAPYECRLYRM